MALPVMQGERGAAATQALPSPLGSTTIKQISPTTAIFLRTVGDQVVGRVTAHLDLREKKVRLENVELACDDALFKDIVSYSLANKCRVICMKAPPFSGHFEYEIVKKLSLAELKQAVINEWITQEDYSSALRARAEPKNSTSPHKLIVEMEGVSFACCEYSEGPVGLTLVKFAEDTKCHKDIRGGNPGILDSQTTVGKNMVEGICIAGGSNPGLAAAAVMADDTNSIEGVVIYSRNLIRKDESKYFVPDERLAKFALKNLSNVLYSGQVGAGCSAAKGQGVASGKVDGYKVLALVVCNSWGDLYPDGNTPAKQQEASEIKLGKRKQNTTITIIVTELNLDDYWLKQLAQQVHNSMSSVDRGSLPYDAGWKIFVMPSQRARNRIII